MDLLPLDLRLLESRLIIFIANGKGFFDCEEMKVTMFRWGYIKGVGINFIVFEMIFEGW